MIYYVDDKHAINKIIDHCKNWLIERWYDTSLNSNEWGYRVKHKVDGRCYYMKYGEDERKITGLRCRQGSSCGEQLPTTLGGKVRKLYYEEGKSYFRRSVGWDRSVCS